MDRCYGNIQLYSAAKQSKIQSLSRKAKQGQNCQQDWREARTRAIILSEFTVTTNTLRYTQSSAPLLKRTYWSEKL